MINSMSASGQAIAKPGGGFGQMSPTANAQFAPQGQTAPATPVAPVTSMTPASLTANLPVPLPVMPPNAQTGFTPQTQLPPVGGAPTPTGMPPHVQGFLANHPLASQYFNNAGGMGGIRDMIAQRLAARFPNGFPGGYGGGGNTRFPIFNPGPPQPGGPVMQPLNATGG